MNSRFEGSLLGLIGVNILAWNWIKFIYELYKMVDINYNNFWNIWILVIYKNVTMEN